MVIFVTLAVAKIIVIPGLHRYDFILLVCLITQYLMFKYNLETKDELKVISVFHVIGFLLEVYKVHVGSWLYPEEAWTKVFGVPLYSGFMYASVASYICKAWHRFHLRMNNSPQSIGCFFLSPRKGGIRDSAEIYTLSKLRKLKYEFKRALTLNTYTQRKGELFLV